MANNITNVLNNRFRLSGMASGLDTDSIIKQLMSVEKLKVDGVKQSKDILEWRRDNYREITNSLRSFQDDFFNFSKPSSNMRSLNNYNVYSSTSTNPSVATVTGGAGVTSMNHTIEVIEMAKAATGSSSGTVTKGMEGNLITGFNLDGYNKSFTITYNGVSKDFVLPNGNYPDAASVIGNGTDGKLKQMVAQAFNGNVTISDVAGKIKFDTINLTDGLTINTKYTSGDSLLSALGVSSSGVGAKLSFTTPIEIKKGMKFEVAIVEDIAGEKITTTKAIQWDANSTYNSINDLASDIQLRIDAAFGANGKVNVTGFEDKLAFAVGTGVESFNLSNSDVVKDLGLRSGDSNKLSLGDTLEKVSSKLISGGITFNGSGKFTLTINNTNIEINKTDTLRSFMEKVNNSTAGVNVSYSAHSDTFNIVAKETGAGTITLNDNGSNFFTKINLTAGQITAGQDASFKLDGLAGTRRTNNYTIDGITYNLASKGTTTISLTQNTDEVFNKIKAFVDKYNEVISKINGELSEKYERGYTPLTDEQKESMDEDNIEKWEEKAKSGLLKNDPILSNIVYGMRTALTSSITDIASGLSSIGIKTGGYQDKGKLVIDESKLKEVIKNSPDKVISIFTKESSVSYNDIINGSGSRTDRYKQSGIVNRLYDILQDSIRTTRDKDGKKGTLLEKAGIGGDMTEFKNIIDEDIDTKSKLIDELTEKMYQKEDRYYRKFAAMEKAMSQMNSQSSWLSQQFGGGQ